MLEAAIVDSGGRIPAESGSTGNEEDSIPTTSLPPPPELEELHQQLEESSLRLSEQAEELQIANQKLLEREQKLLEMLRQREKTQAEINRMLDTMRHLEEELQNLEARLQKQTCKYESVQAQLETSAQLNVQLEAKVAEQDEEIDSLNMSLKVKSS
jgi:chromosome segregation ATPase